jgi:hypothetical protein
MHLSLLSNGLEGNLKIPLGWGKSTKEPLRRCTLTLDECALATEHCVTAAEE